MKVLVACEESQAVCIAFRERGHEAYSCDVKPCGGGFPEWHLQRDLFEVLKEGWDMMIGHPPCTYLTVTGNKWFNIERFGSKALKRWEDRFEASIFFMKMYYANVDKICLENPIGFANSIIKPSQIIQPYYFGDEAQKTTCLWLKNLPPLVHTKSDNLFEQTTHVDRGEMMEWVNKEGKKKSMPKWYGYADKSKGQEARAEIRSKTFPGIAKAMAEQWG